jgi:hypothetical protein
VNDNAGRYFDFEKLSQGQTWITRGALAQVGINNPPIDAAAGHDMRAFASIKPTDVLALELGAKI